MMRYWKSRGSLNVNCFIRKGLRWKFKECELLRQEMTESGQVVIAFVRMWCCGLGRSDLDC